MIKLVGTETMQGTYNGKKYDFDRYNFEKKGMGTQEISVTVSYIDNDKEKIAGDKVAHGSWYDIDKEECMDYLEFVKENNKQVRDIDSLFKNKN